MLRLCMIHKGDHHQESSLMSLSLLQMLRKILFGGINLKRLIKEKDVKTHRVIVGFWMNYILIQKQWDFPLIVLLSSLEQRIHPFVTWMRMYKLILICVQHRSVY